MCFSLLYALAVGYKPSFSPKDKHFFILWIIRKTNWIIIGLLDSGCVFLIGQETFGLIAAIGQFSARSPRSLAELPGFRVRQSVELKKTGTKRKYFLKWKYSKSYLNFSQRNNRTRWASFSLDCHIYGKKGYLFTNSIACICGRITLFVNPYAVGR